MIFLVMQQAKLGEKINRINSEELLHLSQHDALTKVSNRRNFDEMLNSYYEQARHDERPLSLLFIDVDFFKLFNDFYGHQKVMKSFHQWPSPLKTRFGIWILWRAMVAKNLWCCCLKLMRMVLMRWRQIFLGRLNGWPFHMKIQCVRYHYYQPGFYRV